MRFCPKELSNTTLFVARIDTVTCGLAFTQVVVVKIWTDDGFSYDRKDTGMACARIWPTQCNTLARGVARCSDGRCVAQCYCGRVIEQFAAELLMFRLVGKLVRADCRISLDYLLTEARPAPTPIHGGQMFKQEPIGETLRANDGREQAACTRRRSTPWFVLICRGTRIFQPLPFVGAPTPYACGSLLVSVCRTAIRGRVYEGINLCCLSCARQEQLARARDFSEWFQTCAVRGVSPRCRTSLGERLRVVPMGVWAEPEATIQRSALRHVRPSTYITMRSRRKP